MMGNYSNVKGDCAESRIRFVRLVGAGAAVMTVAQGCGFTVTRVGAGDYKLTFGESPGNYIGVVGCQLQSATMTDLKNFSVIVKDFASSACEFTIFNASGTATDLSTAQSLNMMIAFKYTNLAF